VGSKLRVDEIVSLIKKLVSVPRYSLVGLTKSGYLVFGSTQEGAYKLYVLDPKSGTISSLVDEPVYTISKTSRKSDVVVYTVDVSRGYEKVSVFGKDVRSGEVFCLSEGVEPHRVVGFSYDGVRVAWSASVGTRAFIFMSDTLSRRVEAVAEIAGREHVADVNEKYIVGSGHMRGDPFSEELFVVDVKTREMKVFTPREGSVNRYPRLYGSKVLFESNFEDLDTFKLYVYDIESGELLRVKTSSDELTKFNPVEFVDFGWLPDGRVYAIGKKRGRSKLFIDGSEVKTPEGMIINAEIDGDYAYITHTSMREPPRVLRVDLKTSNAQVLVGAEPPRDVVESLAETAFTEVVSGDGIKVPTYVLVSSRGRKPGPTIVYPHGGPWAEVSDSWSPMLLLLTALGYHVVAPNFRGSTGYGEKFRRLDLGDPGGGDLMDVVYAARWAIDSGIADKERLAIFGYSYGGYMSFMAMVKHPDLWRCGVAGAGVTDWVEDYELADAFFKRYDEILFAGRKELFTERSPITYIHNIRSPICIVHPQNDSRCPLRPIMKFAYRLMELGKTFELHVIPDIGHALQLDANAMMKYLLYSTLFLEKYLLQ
jgi:dipeptidyl aminopeptidase/acylaminoacyl peptidase